LGIKRQFFGENIFKNHIIGPIAASQEILFFGGGGVSKPNVVELKLKLSLLVFFNQQKYHLPHRMFIVSLFYDSDH
jgi:hypothetical protein